jgi:DNA-binding transcriptional LysR family regulator
MRLAHVELLHAVMTLGSISAAAQHLRVQQPAVSKAIQRCELELGLHLFERVPGGGVRAQPAAQALWPYVQRAQRRLHAVQRLSQSLGKP